MSKGRKTMDLRTYNTHYRGILAVHASQTIETEMCGEHDLNRYLFALILGLNVTIASN
jgi:hypothetical protein